MKKPILFLSAALTLSLAQAQQISGYEYWFDQDHEAREWVELPDPATDVSLLEAIPANGLPIGPHTVRYRLKDDAGHWSLVLSKPFRVVAGGPNDIIGGEYWFDTDDDDTERAPFNLGPGQDVDEVLDNIPVDGLSKGPHWIRYRLLDTRGQWSLVLSKPFRVTNAGPHHLVLLRYWSDPDATDPSDMTEVPITPNVQYLDIIDDVLFCNWSVTGDSTKVYFQLKDNHGQWSAVITDTVDIDMVAVAPAQPDAIEGPTTVMEGTTATYSVTAVPGASQYTWTLPDGWSGTSTTNSITVTTGEGGTSGVITVTVQNTCGTSPAEELDVFVTGTGLEHDATASGISLFPNPSTGIFTITAAAGIGRITVLDALGRVVQDLRPAQTDRLTLDLSNEANGLYTVRIIQGDQHTKLQVIVQH